MDVLALDLSKSSTGWARWDGVSPQPLYGSVKLGSAYSNRMDTYAAYHKFWLEQKLFKAPDFCVFEAPADPKHIPHATKFQNDRKLIGLAEITYYFCLCLELPYGAVREVSIKTWWPHFNMRAFPKRIHGVNSKELTQKRCRMFGWKPQNSDEADALGILDYEIAMRGQIAPWRAHEQLALNAK